MQAAAQRGEGMRKSWIGALATLLACGAAQAELTSVSANGFELQHQLVLKAEPARVYDALADVGRWWIPSTATPVRSPA